MKKWTRWQDWVALAAGLFAAVSTMWTEREGASTAMMVILGLLLVACAVANLAMPGMPAMEWAQVAVAALLFLSPWLGGFSDTTVAAWTSWITGALAVIVTAAAIKPSMDVHHHRAVPTH